MPKDISKFAIICYGGKATLRFHATPTRRPMHKCPARARPVREPEHHEWP